MDFKKRYLEYFRKQGTPAIIHNDIIWVLYQKIAQPFGPVSFNYKINDNAAKEIAGTLNAWIVRWHQPFGKKKSGWYAVICDKFIPVEKIRSRNTRSKIRRGLKNCEVKKINGKILLESGHEVYLKAFEKYDISQPYLTEEEFKRNISTEIEFEDIIDFWGIFNENKLIGFSKNFIFNNEEVNYSIIKFDPEYLKQYPSYALFHTMNKYYLEEKKFSRVNDGFRNILHTTNIQDFLIDKFSFKKYFLHIRLYYTPKFGIAVRSLYPFRKLIYRMQKGSVKKIAAVLKQEEIRRNCE